LLSFGFTALHLCRLLWHRFSAKLEEMKQKVAKYISIIGHPLITIPLFVIITTFSQSDLKKALFISFLIIGCIFVPIVLQLYRKSKNGTYTNFDVSDRKQRKSMYLFILPLLLVVTAVLYLSGQPANLCLSVFCALILIFISQLVNLYVKSSLHVSMNIYLSFLIMPINTIIGIIVLLFTGLIAWSRIVLGRHTFKEVWVGTILGLIIGLIMFASVKN